MASLPHTRTVTYEEWLRMPEVSDAIEEVVNGQIRIMPPAKWIHARIIHNLQGALLEKLDRQKTLVMVSVFGLVIRKQPLSSRVPDLAIFERETIVERDGYIHSAPQLIAEVLSPANTRREREEKLGDYAELGVPEVWVVSPEARSVEILLLDQGLLRSQAILREGVLKPTRFPGVEIEIPQIWPD